MKRRQKFFLLLFDLLSVTFIGCMVIFFRDGALPAKSLTSPGFWFVSISIVGLQYIFGGYDLTYSTTAWRLLGRSFMSMVASFGLIIVVNYFGGRERTGIFGRGVLGGTLISFGLVSFLTRTWIIHRLQGTMRKSRTLIVGSRKILSLLNQDLEKNHFKGQVFYLLDHIESQESSESYGTWSQIDERLQQKWSSIVVAVDESAPQELTQKLMMARFEANRVRDLVQFYEELWQKVPLYYLGTRWFLLTEGFSLFGNPIRNRVKRFMDVLISLGILVLTSPIMVFVAILIKLESAGPIIYRQVRTGRDGKDFVIYKFRSMRNDAEKDGAQWASKNDRRVTFIGNFLRKTRIDELPQLFNVLKGSMSFVGPRPERPEFNVQLREKIAFYDLRHLIQPGLTGWAQVLYPYGASEQDAQEKLQYDLYYIKNHSLWLDISIILKTVTVVLFGRGR